MGEKIYTREGIVYAGENRERREYKPIKTYRIPVGNYGDEIRINVPDGTKKSDMELAVRILSAILAGMKDEEDGYAC